MKTLLPLTLIAGFALANLTASAADAAATAPKKVLFFSKSSGFEHQAIKPESADGKNGFAFPVMRELGKKENIQFTFSKDGSQFTPEYLAQFDGFCFYTSGDLTEKGKDGNPPMTPAGKQALLDAIAGGKGFVGIHSCSDTCHSPGSEKNFAPARYQNDGDQADLFIRMLGGEFIMHGKQQPGRLIKADPKFPGLETVPVNFQVTEEWYSLKNFPADLHALLVQDVSGMTGDMYERPNYPSTWVRLEGKGRVFYTSMGHRDDIWTNPVFQTVLEAGLNWSLKRVDADVTPNLASVTPKASQLPPSPKKK